MGGTYEEELVRMIGFTPMPITEDKLLKIFGSAGGDTSIVHRVLHTHHSMGWTVKDGGTFWVADKVMAKCITQAEENLVFWKNRIEYLQAQRQALLARNNDKTLNQS